MSYLCVCMQLPRDELEELFMSGWSTDEIMEKTGACTNCGCCKEILEGFYDDKELLKAHLDALDMEDL